MLTPEEARGYLDGAVMVSVPSESALVPWLVSERLFLGLGASDLAVVPRHASSCVARLTLTRNHAPLLCCCRLAGAAPGR